MNLQEIVTKKYNKGIADCSNEELYFALLEMTKAMAEKKENHNGKKKLYYISAEFLIGKLLSNNLINLGVYDEVRDVLAANGKDICAIEEVEPEPSLGNGGLGRLAACFLDSIATLGLNGDGVGLNYHYGLFKQVFENNLQKETKNPWIQDESWLTKTDKSYQVQFGGFNVTSKLYDIDVTGYENTTNKLHLFDIETVDESIVGDGIDFDKEDIKKNLTLFLYPDDSDDKGRLLRVYQQYFMVSNAAQLILDEAVERGCNLHDLADYAVIQINDTHPSMIIPELIRLLMEQGIDFDTATDLVSRTCAYTNHTILAEALEKWPLDYLNEVVPQLVPIIEKLDAKAKEKYKDESVAIIDSQDRVHMAHMDIHYGFSVNGVAALHTDILKNSELKAFYQIYPEKFNNKTNGITFRRWLMHCNLELSEYISSLIGDSWKKDSVQLEKLLEYQNDTDVLKHFLKIKQKNKQKLCMHLKEKQDLDIDPDSIFDIQIKRLHEYKRQQLNALYAIYKYKQIKSGQLPQRPITMIFGAKAAPAYTLAKDIIHLILCLQELIDNDPEVSPYFKVIMLENYNVSKAAKVIPAADISEQISLASKEASGTGNMKFMLNGALTLGTMDGANVEIAEAVGNNNIYIFGQSSKQVIHRYAAGDYCAKDWYEADSNLRRAIDFLTSEEMLKYGDEEHLKRLQNELINKDWFQTLPDFNAYIVRKEQAMSDYAVNPEAWSRRTLINIAEAGFFSSDRTIKEYDDDIWHLGK